MLCVFDIESVPDVKLLRAVYGYEGPSVEVAKMAIEEHGFLPVTFHQVVAISAVIADEFGRFIRVNSIEGESEEALVGSFLKFIDKHNPKLVSFNGRGFDMPLLINRALKYNFTCSAYFETENRALNKNKWDNYRYRYSDNFHIDLLDHIGDFGAVRGLKLDHICQSVGLPGKFDVHGDDVLELYFASEQKKIVEYCESDVLNTYWLYLKYELLRGRITKEDYLDYLFTMSEKLPKKKSYSDIFLTKIDDEVAL